MAACIESNTRKSKRREKKNNKSGEKTKAFSFLENKTVNNTSKNQEPKIQSPHGKSENKDEKNISHK